MKMLDVFKTAASCKWDSPHPDCIEKGSNSTKMFQLRGNENKKNTPAKRWQPSTLP